MQFSFAQEKTVTGVVSDKTGPLPGANVIVKGTKRSAQTDFDGKYSIKAKAGEVLVFSFTGYTNSTVSVGVANSYNVVLKEASVVLEDVVVEGYGKTSTKAKSIGSSQTVSSKTIENRPVANVLQALQGQLAGVNIATFSGQPGTNKIDVIIRGESSLSASTDPLYVIDGVPMVSSFFRNLNPNDIDTVTVLKDASATSIYGNRGANGVIIINTKKGTFKSSLNIRYSSSYGTAQFAGDRYDLMNSRQLLNVQKIRQDGPGFDGIYGIANSVALPGLDVNNINAYNVNTDWSKVFFRIGTTSSHDVSFTSGSENLTNFTSLSFYQQDGIVPTTDFKRFTVRSNFNGKSTNGKLKYGLNISQVFSRRNQLEQETRSTGSSSINTNVLQNPLQGYLSSPSYLSPSGYTTGQALFDQYGSPALELTPYMLLDRFNGNNSKTFFDDYRTSVFGNISYQITKELSIGTTAGGDYDEEKRILAVGPESYLSIVRAVGAGQAFHGLELQSSTREFAFDIVNKISYKKTFSEKHTLEVNAYQEYLKGHRTVFQQQKIGLNPLAWAPGAGTGYIPYNPNTMPTSYAPSAAASATDGGTLSYFGTADYDYDARFGFAASLRRDASYKFVGNNKWGTFWSLAGRWNINKESFMKNVTFVKDLKLRASYGTTGNQNISSRNSDSNRSTLFDNATSVRDLNVTSTGYLNNPSFSFTTPANVDLKWETVAQTNIGIDFNLKDRLIGSFDIYRKKTTGLYYNRPISTAATTLSSFNANLQDGDLINEGYEINLRYNILKNSDLKLSVFANGSYNRNYIGSLGILNDTGTGIKNLGGGIALAEGGPAYQYYVVPYAGVNPANGNLLFLDKNNNLTETPTDSDRRLTNRNYLPKYQGGFGFNASYKGFFTDLTFVYSYDFFKQDGDIVNLLDIRNSNAFPVATDLLNAWTPTNTTSNIPSWNANNLDTASALSDRYIRDASFIRLRNLSLGYDFPAKFLNKTFIKGLKLRVQAENFLTWTKWKGFDPDSFNSGASGYFPTPKSYTFGLDINF
jgi:TonB-linked SusC/RagA family outer membrane protein